MAAGAARGAMLRGGVRFPLEGVWVYSRRSWTNRPAQGAVEENIDAVAGRKEACFEDKRYEMDVQARGWCCSVMRPLSVAQSRSYSHRVTGLPELCVEAALAPAPQRRGRVAPVAGVTPG